MIRVISGKCKGLKLQVPPWYITRPTIDRVREAIFSMLQFEVKDAIVLDAFAGSGVMGIEALSRRAAFCDFVDTNRIAIDVIKSNLQTAKFKDNFCIYNMKFEKFIKSDIKNKRYDIIFFDPPYSGKIKMSYAKKKISTKFVSQVMNRTLNFNVPGIYDKSLDHTTNSFNSDCLIIGDFIDFIVKNGILSRGGKIVFECDEKPEQFGTLVKISKEKRYGNTKIFVLESKM